MMEECAIAIEGLHKSYGRHRVLADFSMRVPRGSIYAYLGRNGEGKTTTIQILLNILSPDRGSCAVLGLDSRTRDVEIRRRVGYVPETPFYYDWMRVGDLLALVARAHPGSWDAGAAKASLEKMKIDPSRRLRELSLGVKAKVGLVAAMAKSPDLLVLDDPTSGLDAVVRREFLETLVELAHGQEKTIFFSSHIITELERVADHVGLIRDGAMLFEEPLDDLKAHYRRIRISVADGAAYPDPGIPPEHIVRTEKRMHEVDVVVRRFDPALVERIPREGIRDVQVLPMDLEEIFVECTRD